MDNKQLVRCVRLRDGASGALDLTTMLPLQDRASVSIYLVNGSATTRVHTFDVEDLLRNGRQPKIVVSAEVETDLKVTLEVDGEPVARAEIAIPPDARRLRWLPWLLAALALLAIGLVGALAWWWLVRGTAVGDTDADRSLHGMIGSVTYQGRLEPRGERSGAEYALVEVGQRWVLYFQPESAELLPEAREIVDQVGGQVRVGVTELLIEGHTALYGNEPARQALSLNRSMAAAEYLKRLLEDGPEAGTPEIVTTGLSGSRPITRDQATQWRNRRVEIIVTGVATRP
ncbi:MAG: OmpA family protein [Spirochaetales bacterium]|nr:MAG: OmpA family protein [Spirochaetales bacterium]